MRDIDNILFQRYVFSYDNIICLEYTDDHKEGLHNIIIYTLGIMILIYFFINYLINL